MKVSRGEAERRKRKPAADHSLTAASMGSFSSITASFLLLLAVQLPGPTRANPVYSSVANSDLMDFKVGAWSEARRGWGGERLGETLPVGETSFSPCVFPS